MNTVLKSLLLIGVGVIIYSLYTKSRKKDNTCISEKTVIKVTTI